MKPLGASPMIGMGDMQQKANKKVKERHDTRRRFEQWVKNPNCDANVVSAVHGISMADVAKSEGGEPTMGQSPFALARGQRFEALLFLEEAKRLRDALEAKRVLPSDSSGFRDLRLRNAAGHPRTLTDALAQTEALLREVARVPAQAPSIVAAPTVSVPGGIMLPEALLVIDALVIRADLTPVELVVGEIKTYPDRGGHTDPQELATARAQAGVYVHGLRLVLAALELDTKLRVSDLGFLVLTKPGSNNPSVRAGEDLRYQAKRAERGFQQLRQIAAGLELPPEGSERMSAVIEARTSYCGACVSFCDRADLCRDRAEREGNPAILGDDAARVLGNVSLLRALDLLDNEKPRNDTERELAEELKRVAEVDK